MNSPVSAQEPEHDNQHNHEQTPEPDQPAEPRRLSAPYQYHNAPEVAPAYGLEYDDTIYPVSDKMTIVREFPFRHHLLGHRSTAVSYDSDNRPPRIICGMKVSTFLVVAFIILLVVVGAAVGGVVGGRNLGQSAPSGSRTYASPSLLPSTKTTTTPPATPTYTPHLPTYTPLPACPSANNTLYTAPLSTLNTTTTTTTSQTPHIANQTFTLHCSLTPPQPSKKLTGAYVYTLADCIDLCAAYNFAALDAVGSTSTPSSSSSSSSNETCTLAFYQPAAARPVNCWIAASQALIGSLQAGEEGLEVGILVVGV
ncbi:hypothetical protein BDY17DRAFT_344759 [Neohortaea acidophila]|uniref:Apple domain-containing protein n=1 Tax=Neohortaea acidophila TaxID=245834 RepID=A0A6A6PXF2_9PEZI|nr:uncharacterized protein BDY17DRAFT_344759 [Neohortaea acidophila]KAF2483917.1 hypothetical protein BDY17DRAFT_344759 [Neohortaea acidophila]